MPKKFFHFTVFIIIDVFLAIAIIAFVYNRSMPKPKSSPRVESTAGPQLATSTLGKLTVWHPSNYTASEKDRDGRKVLVLEKTGTNLKVAVFKKLDFKNGEPTWLFPQMSENSGEYLPLDYTEAMPIGGKDGYVVWLYYDKFDSAGKSELYKIFETIRYN